jgi:hypothetical protein
MYERDVAEVSALPHSLCEGEEVVLVCMGPRTCPASRKVTPIPSATC